MINEIDDMQELYEKYGKDIVDPVTKAYEAMGPGLMTYYGTVLTSYYMERRALMTFLKHENGCSWEELEKIMSDLEEDTFKLHDQHDHIFEEAIDEFKRFTAGHDDHDRTSDEEKQSADID